MILLLPPNKVPAESSHQTDHRIDGSASQRDLGVLCGPPDRAGGASHGRALFSSRSPLSTGKIEELAVGLKENYTIVIVTHNMPQAARIADFTGFMLLGDLAVNIAERAVYLSTHDKIEFPFDLQDMAEKAQEMFNGSLDAMINLDTDLAQKVCNADDEVDAMNREAYSLVEKRIRQNPDQLNSMIQFLSAARYLERVADHATNIAEDVIYLVDGNIIRHSKENSQKKPEYSG